MKTLYLDVFSGISGDMFVGALLDLGLNFRDLERELKKLNLDEYHLHISRGQKAHIEGTKFDVHLEHDHHSHDHDKKHQYEPGHGHHHHHDHHSHGHEHEHEEEHEHAHGRNFADIKKLISQSGLSDWVKQKAISIFHRIAIAEAKIHGRPAEQVHFHEVGAVDSIVDIVAACIGLDLLGKPRVECSAITEGTGWIDCAHGKFPVPAPATLEILSARKVPIQQCDEPHELVTPTGAAIVAEFAERVGPMHGLSPTKIGYGLGTRDNKTRPNVLRAVLCEAATPTHDWDTDTVCVLQTNLDDINSEILGQVMERALMEGALDVFHTPVYMKKNRPGVLFTLLCASPEADKFSELILRETSAFGVRRYETERRKLKREIKSVKTPYGEVAVKIGKLDGSVIQVSPEYESCRKLAEQSGIPLKAVYDAALRTANP